MVELIPKCFKCGSVLDGYSKCTCCYDELGAKLTAATERETFLEEVRTELHDKLMKSRERGRVLREALEGLLDLTGELLGDGVTDETAPREVKQARAALAAKEG